MRLLATALLILFFSQIGFCQAGRFVPIDPQRTSANSSSKPQSKVWKYKEAFYAVFPNDSGTYIWKMLDQRWIPHLLLTTNNQSKADCYAVSDTVYILLFQGQNSEFTALKFEEHSQQYQFLNLPSDVSRIYFDPSTETATIAVDSWSTLWITYESENNTVVRNSAPPYTSWSLPETIYAGVADDDISAIVKMSNSIGILWSNQNTKRFGFKLHIDGNSISSWSNDETPAAHSALYVGDGMADDHINLKYTSEGNLYAAIKTSYDTPSYTKIGLLVRRSNGSWDDLYHISYTGTRPIVAIDEGADIIKVYYTSKESGGEIVFKESRLEPISFGPEIILIDGNAYNNASSTKFPYQCDDLVIASDDRYIVGKVINCR